MNQVQARQRTELGLGLMAVTTLAMSLLAVGIMVTQWLSVAGHVSAPPNFRGVIWIPPGVALGVDAVRWLSVVLLLGALLVARGCPTLGVARPIAVILAASEVLYAPLVRGFRLPLASFYPSLAAFGLPALLVAIWPRRWRAIVLGHAGALLLLLFAMLWDRATEPQLVPTSTVTVSAVWGLAASLALFKARRWFRTDWCPPTSF